LLGGDIPTLCGMSPPGAGRLTKADAELLLDNVDGSTLQSAVHWALLKVLGLTPETDWKTAVVAAGTLGNWSESRVQALLSATVAAMQDLAIELNEDRTVTKR
jgi:hypothetical protein